MHLFKQIKNNSTDTSENTSSRKSGIETRSQRTLAKIFFAFMIVVIAASGVFVYEAVFQPVELIALKSKILYSIDSVFAPLTDPVPEFVSSDLNETGSKPITSNLSAAKNETIYYNYSHLDNDQREIYDQILDDLKSCDIGLQRFYGISQEDFKLLFWRVIDDHPELFHVKKALNVVENPDGYVEVQYSFNSHAHQIEKYQEQINKALQQAMNEIGYPETEYELVRAIYQYVIDHVSYHPNCENSTTIACFPDGEQITSSLLTGTSVCAGYAKMMQIICQEYGLTAVAASGMGKIESGEYAGHLWVIVEIDGELYHCDPTYEDSYLEKSGEQGTDYAYFCKSDSVIFRNHKHREGYYPLPQCSSDRYD